MCVSAGGGGGGGIKLGVVGDSGEVDTAGFD